MGAEDGVVMRVYYWLTRPYLEWRWRRDRAVVCIAPWCLRMCAEEFACHCAKHGAMYE